MRLLAFDTETYLIQPTDAAPKPVCCTWADETATWITDPWSMETLITLASPDVLLVGQNIPYDLVLLMRWRPETIPPIMQALEEGRVFDTAMRERMLHLKNHGTKGFDMLPSLEKMAAKYLGLDLSKDKKGDDIWRLKYGTLDGVHFSNWPAEALRYALEDARHTFDVFKAQGGISDIQPTEALQVQSAVVLQAIGVWGFAVNQERRLEIKGKLEAKAAALHTKIDQYQWTGNGSAARLRDLVTKAWYIKNMGLLKLRESVTGVSINPEVWGQTVKPDMSIKTVLQESLDAKTPIPGLVFPPGTDWKAWTVETIKLLPDIPMTTKGVSTAGEVLESLGDIVKEFADYTELRHVEKMIENYIAPYNTDTVHPKFVPLVTTGRTGCRKPNCFSNDTEVLTSKGWVSFYALTESFKTAGLRGLPDIAQWCDGDISFTPPTNWVSYTSFKVVNIRNMHTDLLVTDDHRCLVLDRHGNKHIYTAYDYPNAHFQLGAGVKTGEDDHTYEDWFLRLCVAVQADGNWQDGGWSFSFRKERKHRNFIKIMNEAGITEYRSSESVDSMGIRYRNRIYKSELSDRIFSVLSGEHKHLPSSWVTSLSYRQMKIIGDESFLWDGLSTRRNNYSSSVKHNCDIMQALYIMTGNRTNQRVYMPPSGRPNYQCDITDRNWSGTKNISKTTIFGPIEVSCCSVPSGFIVVRRNGKVMITGQCQNIPRKDKSRPDEGFRTMFKGRPGTVLGTVDYSQLELSTLAATIRAMFPDTQCLLGNAIDEGKDVHCITGALISGMTYEQMLAGKKAKDEKVLHYRQGAKACNFGLPGGLGGVAFVGYARANYGLEITLKDAWQYINSWKRAWPEVPSRYLKYSSDQTEASPQGVFTAYTITGRPKAGCFYTEGSNYPFQGLAADGAKAALWGIWKEAVLGWYWSTHPGFGYGHEYRETPLRMSRLVNFVHDEIVAEHPQGDLGVLAMKRQEAIMVAEMTRICQNKITISVEGKLSDAWEH